MDFDLTPEARLGYRYDVLQQAVKIKAAFESTGGRGTAAATDGRSSSARGAEVRGVLRVRQVESDA